MRETILHNHAWEISKYETPTGAMIVLSLIDPQPVPGIVDPAATVTRVMFDRLTWAKVVATAAGLFTEGS